MQQFLQNENLSSRAKIIIDHRESESFDKELAILGADTERKSLEIGDFLCSGRAAIERKTRMDFEQSIMDGRLFSQLSNLKANYERVIIIVEGEESAGVVRRESLLGAYATVITDYGAALFFTRDMKKSAELIYAIAKHEQLAEKRPLRIYAKRKTFTVAQCQRAIVETFPMLGPKLAKALLEHFGSIENIAGAGEKELLEVDGMGKKRAKAMRSIVSGKYEAKDDKFDFV